MILVIFFENSKKDKKKGGKEKKRKGKGAHLTPKETKQNKTKKNKKLKQKKKTKKNQKKNEKKDKQNHDTFFFRLFFPFLSSLFDENRFWSFDCMFWIIFVCLYVDLCLSTGKGTNGIYTINDEYILVSDSNLDQLLVLDLLRGGIVGHRKIAGADLTGVASCDSCRKIFVTANDFFTVTLEEPLKEMAKKKDFSSLSTAPIKSFWPFDHSIQPKKMKLRMIALTRSGSLGFLVDFKEGVFQFDPTRKHNKELNRRLISKKDIAKANKDGGISGCSLTRSEEYLIITGTDSIFLLNLARLSTPTLKSFFTTIPVKNRCGMGGIHLRDAAMRSKNETFLYVVGHSSSSGNYGAALYKLGVKNKKCSVVIGKHAIEPGWVDGYGESVRFTRPHTMTFLPNSNLLVLTDMDNRAVRTVNLIQGDPHFGEVSTVYYSPLDIPSLATKLAANTTRLVQLAPTDPVDFFSATKMCEQRKESLHLCSMRELRQSWFEGSLQTINSSSTPITIWTAESCHSCWLQIPGKCPKSSKNESSVRRAGSMWGSNHQMIARLFNDGRIQTLCQEKALLLEQAPFCCA